MEGHTDSKPYSSASTYTNWELSSDRANAARRLMLQHGIRIDQVTQVRGFADQRLRKKENPLDPSNRRISLIVQYLPKKPTDPDAKGEKSEGAEPKEGKSDPGESKSEKPEGKSEKPESKPAEKK
jgi:chemotaxis protein MotB